MPCAIVILILALIAIVYWSLIVAFIYSHEEIIEDRSADCGNCGYSRAGRPESSPCPECGEVTPVIRIRVMTVRTFEPARLLLFLGAVVTILLYELIRNSVADAVGTTHRVGKSGDLTSGPMDWTVAAAWHYAVYLAYAGGLVRPVPFQRAKVNTLAFCAVSALVYGFIGVVVGPAFDKPAAEAIGLMCSGVAIGACALAVSGGLGRSMPGARTSV